MHMIIILILTCLGCILVLIASTTFMMYEMGGDSLSHINPIQTENKDNSKGMNIHNAINIQVHVCQLHLYM